jgi:hypothetical protein
MPRIIGHARIDKELPRSFYKSQATHMCNETSKIFTLSRHNAKWDPEVPTKNGGRLGCSFDGAVAGLLSVKICTLNRKKRLVYQHLGIIIWIAPDLDSLTSFLNLKRETKVEGTKKVPHHGWKSWKTEILPRRRDLRG